MSIVNYPARTGEAFENILEQFQLLTSFTMLIPNIFSYQFRGYLVSHCPHKIPILQNFPAQRCFSNQGNSSNSTFELILSKTSTILAGECFGRRRKKNMNMIMHCDPSVKTFWGPLSCRGIIGQKMTPPFAVQSIFSDQPVSKYAPKQPL